MGKRRGAYRVLVGKTEKRRPLRRTRSKWDDNIKMDFKESEWKNVSKFDLAQDRSRYRVFVNAVMNIRVPQNAGIC